MKNIADRIKELIENQGLSNSDFAKRTNLNPAIISHILGGRNKPSLQVIQAIKTEFTNVNLDYLINGSGELYNDLTNVNKASTNPSVARQTGFDFPMEGLRVASVGQPAIKRESELPEVETTAESRQVEKEVSATSGPQGSEDQSIEQIVIFYRDGSFKAYRP